MNAPTACVNHGVFFSVEKVMFILTEIENMFARLPSASEENKKAVYKAIRSNEHYRAELLELLGTINLGSFSEINEMDNLIMSNLGIPRRMEKLRYYLEIAESGLEVLYDRKTNKQMMFLTILGLLLAALQVGPIIWNLVEWFMGK